MYIERQITTEIFELIEQFPVVCIIGPRQSGKTTLAKNLRKQLAKDTVYLDLELPKDRTKLDDPQLYIEEREDKCIILDEIQQVPELFAVMRGLIDRHRVPGRFIVLGSASPDLLKQSSETLAGRIAYIELPPFNLTEILDTYSLQQHWFRGGFPGAFLAKTVRGAQRWQNNFVQTYLERDLPQLGLNVSSVLMRRLWTMIAHYHGGIWKASSFASSLDLTIPTINRYVDFLDAAFIVYRLQPFYFNLKKRIVKSPKIYIRDSGLLHHLTGINDFEALHGNTLIGKSWEGYVIEQIRQLIADFNIEMYYYRTHNGTESDLVLVRGLTPVACIEIKYTSAPKVTKGFKIAIEDLETKNNFIIVPKSETYPVSKTINVCGLGEFLKKHLSKV